ncbi:MAG: hypothetical protein LBI13_04235 [Streptococcaceae bacterium]|jgi:Rgg/GadR/MutR family transcriptional activator|nr:hypothetical protein [Streptococcaceae bacterium]
MDNYSDIIGMTFRQVRESRSISLSTASKGVLSKSQLARFEKNESQLRASALLQLLDNIGAAPEEFFHILRQYDIDDSSKMFDKVGIYEQESKWIELKKLYDECVQKFEKTLNLKFRIQAISIKAILYSHKEADCLSKNEKDFIIKMLYDNVNWGMRELRLFNCTLTQLPYHMSTELMEDLLKKGEYYRNVPENRKLIIMVLRSATWNSLYHKDFGHGYQYKEKIREIAINYNDYFAWIVSKTLAYSCENERENWSQALMELDELSEIYNLLGADFEAKNISEERRKLINRIKK